VLAACATQIGVSERALEITTNHLRERVQFGAQIGSFPAVQQRAADAWIDLQAIRWTAWRAAWRLAEGLPAARELLIAKFWAAEAGSRIANTAQHLHGGLGVDVDYPIHRYFLWSKSLELLFGGASPTLARLGRELAAAPPGPEAEPR
jgi:alkylation response protein AidB-like acyl-CoA dehydrogenase